MPAILLAIALVGATPEAQAIASAQYRDATETQRANWRYILAPPGQRADPPLDPIQWEAAISWAICHSCQAVDLGSARPVKIAPGVLRIDLAALGWAKADWLAFLARSKYPYFPHHNPLFIRGDWLLVQLADSSKSDAYLRLQFGDPKSLTRDNLLAKMEVDRARAKQLRLDHGLVETRSQVAIQRMRVLEFYPRLAGYSAGTRDFFEHRAENSPLEFPTLEGVQHDGEEWIVGLPRYWPGGRGVLQSYFLADASGKLVKEAPVRLVEDRNHFRGVSSIRFPGSCYGCHRKGLNAPTENGLQAWLADGIELQTQTAELQQFLDRWHLTGTTTTMERANEDNAAAIRFATFGMEQEAALANYLQAVHWYDKPLDLDQAGAELGTDGKALQTTLAITSDRAPIGGHLAALAHGRPLRRDLWESLYQTTQQILLDDSQPNEVKP